MDVVRRADEAEVTQMPTTIPPEDQAAWLAAAEAAGLSPEDDRKTLIDKAAALGIKAGWMVGIQSDIHGEEHEAPVAYAVTKGIQHETVGAASVEVALRLAIGEALVKRGEEVQ